MTITPDQYEKLGSFYLGRTYDMDAKQANEELLMYDSKDLVTHGVVLGMTGSGKTGLCLSLIEEAAMDGIPIIAVDPKGDIGNVMFTFPKLTGEVLKPWVNEDDARRKEMSVDDYAQAQADLWKKGLGEWGQSEERIAKLREKTDFTIYTPGSNAGIPVSILSSLETPSEELMEDREMLADRIESTVSSLLALCNINADPVQSVEHILISNIIGYCWAKGKNITIENLVRLIQQPPMAKIGVESVDNFFPEKKRGELAMKLNNLIASPGFQVWMEGEPLDIQRMFYTAEGKPRVSIFNIAHLSDTERMFFVSLLMNQLLGWMRAQSGTTSLRALFYMDEIYGYLPPTAMPPSKKPMMILLKQARAFGLGMLLATQNPVDLDYKALSNIGTWWLGRLQTERDKMRVLDGLEGAVSSQGGKFERGDIEKILGGLGNRVFLMNNVHEDHPEVMQVRWTMSYLRGPVSRNEIKKLMDPVRPKSTKAAGKGKVVDTDSANAADASNEEAEDDGFAPPSAKGKKAKASSNEVMGNTHKPTLPDGVSELFYPVKAGVDDADLSYVPALIRSAVVNFDDAKRKITGRSSITLINEIDAESQKVDWEKFIELPKDLDLSKLGRKPEGAEDTTEYGDLPGAAMKAKTFTAIAKDFTDWVYANHSVEVSFSPLLDAYSNIGETVDAFKARVSQTAREQRDAAVEELRTKAAKSVKSMEDKLAKALATLDAQKAQASSAKLQTAISIGSSILGALLGRKSGITGAASMIKGSTVTAATRAWKEGQEAGSAEDQVERLKVEHEALIKDTEDQVQKIRDQYDTSTLKLEATKLTPMKKNISGTATGIIWMPHERLGDKLRPAWEEA
jgi:vacuolar-type H+-ATPase subunit H